MFRKVICYPHIDFYDLVKEIEKTNYNGDFEANFMEHYLPSPTCSIRVEIPADAELKTWDWEKWEHIMFSTLKENGFNPGESVYVDIDY